MLHHDGMDTENMRARVLDAYQHGPEAVVALVATLMSDLAAQLEALSARVTALEGENATLRAKLETTSHNSSKPPSSDGPGVKPHPKSQRTRSGRQPGGQPGHAGHTVRLVDGGCTPKPPKIPSRSRTTSESPGADAVVVFMADPAVSKNTRSAVSV